MANKLKRVKKIKSRLNKGLKVEVLLRNDGKSIES
jgi:hypothetical protein